MSTPGFIASVVTSFFRALGSTVVGKHSAVLVGLEGAVGGVEEDDPGEHMTDVEAYGAPAIVFRPLPPSVPKGEVEPLAAEGFGVRTNDGIVPLAWRDLRLNRAFPNPKPGDVALVGYGANFVKLGADGSISVVATNDATPDGKLVQFQVLGEGFVWLGPWGKITYDTAGFHLLHHTGARIDLGGIGGLPPPLDQLGSYATIEAAISKIKSSAIVLGPDSGTPDNVARATPTLATFTALQADLVAVQGVLTTLVTTLNAYGSTPTLPITGAHMAALGAALGTAMAALASAITSSATTLGTATNTLPSQSTSVT